MATALAAILAAILAVGACSADERGEAPPAASGATATQAVPAPTSAATSTAAPAANIPAVTLCTPTDPRLSELSGLAEWGSYLLAMGDDGERITLVALDPLTCAAVGEITADSDPRDVEDLAPGPDGSLWVGDIGDNNRERETVALHHVSPAWPGQLGEAPVELFRMSYPDGPHDAESLVISPAGRPVIITKELSGVSGIYTTTGPLSPESPTPLVRVGEVSARATGTVGGPLPWVSASLFTGASLSGDGLLLALRTYTDAYLFNVANGDVIGALAAPPATVIALPWEPQGEAVALTGGGTLLSGGESPRVAAGELEPIRMVTQGLR